MLRDTEEKSRGHPPLLSVGVDRQQLACLTCIILQKVVSAWIEQILNSKLQVRVARLPGRQASKRLHSKKR